MDKQMVGPLRKVMAAFIRADSRSIVLRRPVMEKTPAGGYRKAGFAPLPAQDFRLVPYKRRLTDMVKNMANGEIPQLLYVLVGFYNADVQRMDEFDLDGAYYRVQGIEPHTGVELYTDRKVAQLMVLDKEGVDWG